MHERDIFAITTAALATAAPENIQFSLPAGHFATSLPRDLPASPVPPAPEISQPPDDPSTVPGEFILPHEQTFVAVWQSFSKLYYQYYDEALRRSYTDAMAMRRDGLIHELLRHRQLPVCSLPWKIVPDDPKDPRQIKIAKVVTAIVEKIPRFHSLCLALSEAIFYGKAGSQINWGKVLINGRQLVTAVDHLPVNGDKILWQWGGIPAVAVRAGAELPKDIESEILIAWQSRALSLRRQDVRDRFIIHRFEPTDTDFLEESEMGAAAYGLGLRSRLWFIWKIRNEVLSWSLDALQKLGTNGLLYGRYPNGNDKARDEMLTVLAQLVRNKVAAIPDYFGNQSVDRAPITAIPVSAVGYDVIKSFIDYFDDMMRRIVLGQTLSSDASNQGSFGNKAAEVIEATKDSILRADAKSLQETLTEDLIRPILRKNEDYLGKVDFGLRFEFEFDKPDALPEIQTAQLLVGMGAAIDMDDLVEKAGLKLSNSAATNAQTSLASVMGQVDPNATAPPAEAGAQEGAGPQTVMYASDIGQVVERLQSKLRLVERPKTGSQSKEPRPRGRDSLPAPAHDMEVVR